MTRTPDDVKNGLNDPIPVHFHIGDPEPRLTPLAMVDLKELHADALALIQQLQAENAEKDRKIQQLEATVSEKEKVVAELSGKIGQLESQNRCFKENKESCEKRMVDLAQRMPRWISVEERLPECDKIVLGYTNRYGGQCEMVYYSNRIMAWCQNGCLLIPNVTHWMPLPPMLKEEAK